MPAEELRWSPRRYPSSAPRAAPKSHGVTPTSTWPFQCPACGHGVLIRKRYVRVIGIVSLVVASLVVYGLGIRGDALIPAFLLVVFPIKFVVAFMTLRLFPPDVELTGDYRGILYDAKASTEASTLTPESASEPTEESQIFKQRPESWTLESVGGRGAAIVLMLWAGWKVAQLFLFR
jgi:hypothetical protein